MSAKLVPLLRSDPSPLVPAPYADEEDPDLANVCEDESNAPPLGKEVLDEEGDEELPLFFSDPWNAEFAGTLPPFGGGVGVGAPELTRLELPFSLDFDRERFYKRYRGNIQ